MPTPLAAEPDARTPALELERVAHRFGGTWVLRGCSLTVPRGRAVALLGSNGAGKTTLLRVAATLLTPSRGAARVFGHDVVRDAADARGLIGMLGTSPALYEDLTAVENLRFAQRMRGAPDDAATIDRVLDEVGLLGHRKSRVRDFSSGMRRRVALARLLMHPPRLLLLDEPYAAFDTDGIERVNRFVTQVKESGGAALVATHDLPRAVPVVDSVVRLEAGVLAPEGSSDAPADESVEADVTARLRVMPAAGGAR